MLFKRIFVVGTVAQVMLPDYLEREGLYDFLAREQLVRFGAYPPFRQRENSRAFRGSEPEQAAFALFKRDYGVFPVEPRKNMQAVALKRRKGGGGFV